jgi:hypothetical protein
MMSCNSKKETVDAGLHKKEIDEWHAKRVERLKSETGWLNVAGLYWLKEGFNTFGSSGENDIVFPEGKIPTQAGTFIVKSNVVEIEVAPDVEITSQAIPVAKMVVYADSMRSPQLEYGSLRWFIIRRENLIGIRLRDLENPPLKEFKGIERFPVSVDWRVEARFQKYDPPREIEITNILGQTYSQPSPGALVFEVDGAEYRLDAVDEGGDEYFMIVGDKTNEDETTYPSGRYMYVSPPNENDMIILDFNKLYNPPCAFTPYATCPLPPRQNVLDLAITAGELNYGHHTAHE